MFIVTVLLETRNVGQLLGALPVKECVLLLKSRFWRLLRVCDLVGTTGPRLDKRSRKKWHLAFPLTSVATNGLAFNDTTSAAYFFFFKQVD